MANLSENSNCTEGSPDWYRLINLLYIQPIVCVAGILSNIVSVVVLHRLCRRPLPNRIVYRFLKYTNVVDLVYFAILLPHVANLSCASPCTPDSLIENKGSIYSRYFYVWGGTTLEFVNSVLTATLCLDRLCLFYDFPHLKIRQVITNRHSKYGKSKTNRLRIYLVIVVVLGAVLIFPKSYNTVVTFACENIQRVELSKFLLYYRWIIFVGAFWLPAAVIVIVNTILAFYIRRIQFNISEQENTQRSSITGTVPLGTTRRLLLHQRTTCVLFFLTFAWLILRLPGALVNVFRGWLSPSNHDVFIHFSNLSGLFAGCLDMPTQLAVDRSFRKELCRVLSLGCWRIKKRFRCHSVSISERLTRGNVRVRGRQL